MICLAKQRGRKGGGLEAGLRNLCGGVRKRKKNGQGLSALKKGKSTSEGSFRCI